MKFSYQREKEYNNKLRESYTSIEDVYEIIINLNKNNKLSPVSFQEKMKGLLMIQGYILKNGDIEILKYNSFLNLLFEYIENEHQDIKNISLDIIESFSLREELNSDDLDKILFHFRNSLIKNKCMEIYFIHYLKNKKLEEKLFKSYGIQFTHEFVTCSFENLSSLNLILID